MQLMESSVLIDRIGCNDSYIRWVFVKVTFCCAKQVEFLVHKRGYLCKISQVFLCVQMAYQTNQMEIHTMYVCKYMYMYIYIYTNMDMKMYIHPIARFGELIKAQLQVSTRMEAKESWSSHVTTTTY